MKKLILLTILITTSLQAQEDNVCPIKIYKDKIESLEQCKKGDVIAYVNKGMEWDLRWVAKMAAICEFDSIKVSVSESAFSGVCYYRGKENILNIRETNKWVKNIKIID